MGKKVKNIITVVILILVVSFSAYYFWPKNQAEVINEPKDSFFEFKILDKTLSDSDKQEYTERFDKIKKFLEENPDQLDGWLQLGMVKKYIGDYKGAEQAWIKAGELRPQNSISFASLSDLYVNFTKEYDKAEPAFRTAIKNSLNEEKNAIFYRNFFSFYKDNLQDNQKAEEVLLEGIKNNPKSDLLVLMADFYKNLNRNEEAINYYRQYLKLYPDDVAVKKELQNLYK